MLIIVLHLTFTHATLCIKMAGISSQLQDYLSKSSKSSGPSGNNVTTSKGGYLNYFSKGNEADAAATDFDETSKVNGWFAEAQKDPLLPSLVSQWGCREGVTISRGPTSFVVVFNAWVGLRNIAIGAC